MKFIVAQTGARRGYAVPAILERAGMLERFYTDICADVGLGRALSWTRVLPFLGSQAGRLAGRKLPVEIRGKTRTFAGPNLRWWWRAAWAANDPTTCFRLDTRRTLELGHSAARSGFGQATHLYTMLTEFSPLMVAARECGVTVVAEVYILISTEKVIAQERHRFPDWEPGPPNWDSVRRELLPEDVLFTRVDHYVCPSEAVRDDLVQHWSVAVERTVVVPYGMSSRWLALEPKPQRGRVLFVGTADLRKGIHYLAMASEQLKLRGLNYEFRLAGNVAPQVAARPECRYLNFLGRVPRERIHEEFQSADVFVLPTLAEGSAEVTYEALAAGVPVITTRAAGSVLRDGIEGRIVPERDAPALANAIEELIEDRALRDRLAVAARQRACGYTWEKYGERLLAALQRLPS